VTLRFDTFIVSSLKTKKLSTLRRLIKKQRVHAGSIPAISTDKHKPPSVSEVVLCLADKDDRQELKGGRKALGEVF